jgi:putative MATE family efflux protein
MRHVLVMTSASSVGMIAMFGVDLVDLYFLTLLGEQAILAAVGFAGALLYFLLSLGIGLQIALGALVARNVGAGDHEAAGRFCSSALLFNALCATVLAVLAWWRLPELLMLLGASGDTLDYALRYARIQIPAVPILVVGMSLGAGLRAVGDARRQMLATVSGAVVNACLDPLFIFTFGWGIEGAAWASVVARVCVFLIAGWALLRVHRLPAPVTAQEVARAIPPLLTVGLPAVLTNLATPLGNSLLLRLMSEFGDAAVAAQTVLARMLPVAFAAVFAISGAVGPVIGQNAGGVRYDRVRQTLGHAALFIVAYVAVVWLVLWLLSDHITRLFAVTAVAAELIRFYLWFLVGAFVLNGLLFVANAAFNNLGRAIFATAFNYGKVLLGIVPAAYLLSGPYAARGVLMGEALGMTMFGALGFSAALLLTRTLERQYPPLPEPPASPEAVSP